MDEKDMSSLLEGVIKDILGDLQGTIVPVAGSSVCSADTYVSSLVNTDATIPVELSARHVHLSEQDAIALFGGPLTPVRELSQPGQFLCKERVRLIGPKGVIDNVAVLGPSRGKSQVEVSRTDARSLGVDAPVRQSGDIAGTPGIVLTSNTEIIGLKEGVIVAARHIHMSPEDAKSFGVVDNDLVNVRIGGTRPVILEKVLVRVNSNFKLAMHIDSDEGNSSGWDSSVAGRIVGKSGAVSGRSGN